MVLTPPSLLCVTAVGYAMNLLAPVTNALPPIHSFIPCVPIHTLCADTLCKVVLVVS